MAVATTVASLKVLNSPRGSLLHPIETLALGQTEHLYPYVGSQHWEDDAMAFRGGKLPSSQVLALFRSLGLREDCGRRLVEFSRPYSVYSTVGHASGRGREGSPASARPLFLSSLSPPLFRAPDNRRAWHGSSASFAARGSGGGDTAGDGSEDGPEDKVRLSKLIDSLEGTESFEALKAKDFLAGFFVDDAASGASPSSSPSSSSSDDELDELVEDANASTDAVTELDETADVVLRELRGLRRGSRRVVLQKLLQGGILSADATAAEALKSIERSFRPPPGFRMKVVHIARTSKGTRAGGFARFSALVVVGNGEGVLGWGTGKAVEVANAVQKAQQSAYRNLYPVPRHHGHTITEEVTATFGKTKVIMYPKSSGRGIVANPMLAGVCHLAGIYDIGVKVHGSRNPQNTIKCLFAAFDKLRSEDELAGYDEAKGVVRVPCLTGRFGKRISF